MQLSTQWEKDAQKRTWLAIFRIVTIIGSVASIVAIVLYLLPTPKLELNADFCKIVGIVGILIVLAVQSIVFFLSFVTKTKDSTLGHILSVMTAITFLCLLFAAFRHPSFHLVTAGAAMILAKCIQLYYGISESFKSTRQYLTSAFIKCACLFFAVGLIGFLIETNMIDRVLVGIWDNFNAKGLVQYAIDHSDATSVATDSLKLLRSELDFQEKFIRNAIISQVYLVALIVAILINLLLTARNTLLTEVVKELANDFSGGSPSEQKGEPVSRIDTISAIHWGILLRSLRPLTSLIAGAISVTGYLFSAQSPSLHVCMALLSVVSLTSIYGFGLNDLIDIPKDRRSVAKRLPYSNLRTKTCLLIVCFSALTISLLISSRLGSLLFMVNACSVILLSIYSPMNNRYGIWANIFTSLLSALVLVISMLAGAPRTELIVLSIAAFFLILGREIILDIRDFEADKCVNKSSIPIRYGTRVALILVFTFLAMSSIMTTILCAVRPSLSTIIFIGVFANSILWVSFLKYFKSPSSLNAKLFFAASKIAFVMIVPGLLI